MDSDASNIFKRNCVTCPLDGPQCPKCPSGKVCTFSVQTCEKCPEAQCVDNGSNSGMSGNTTGAIAGGVVGGLIGLSLLLGFILWYKFRHRRRRHLQSMKEMELENDSALDYPMTDADGSAPGPRPPSITSTYGFASHRSNVIPIILPFNNGQSTPNIGASSRPNTAYSNGGFIRSAFGQKGSFHPVLRDSIGFSELSIDSDSTSVNTQGSRSYDVAVQGMPSLVDSNKARRIPIQQPQLGVISENGAFQGDDSNRQKSGIDAASTNSPQSRTPSSKRRSVMSMRSMRSYDAELPELPDSLSCFDDSAAIRDEEVSKSRYSQASSNNYDANLPEEVKMFINQQKFE